MIDLMSQLPGLSPVAGKSVVAKFDGGRLSSDGGILVLREIEQRLRVADRLPAEAFCRDEAFLAKAGGEGGGRVLGAKRPEPQKKASRPSGDAPSRESFGQPYGWLCPV